MSPGPRVGIVGLGTAGSAVAALCARRGLAVVGLERGPLAEAGARWVNGVPRWMFGAAGFAEPTGPELRSAEGPYHLVAGFGPRRVLARSGLEVDMRALVARLQAEARASGAELREGVRVRAVHGRVAETDAGEFAADVWVDASGSNGARLLGQPAPDREDLCAAAQEVREVREPAGAAAFLARQGAREGEPVCFTSVAGGYSVVNVRVQGGEVGLLCGSVPALGQPSGSALLAAFVAREPWIGERRFGGARAVPLRRPWEVVGQGDRALAGDAAGLVFAAHGSGIGIELLAARLLADALAEGRGTWGYNVAVQRELGGLLAASDLFRRFSATLDAGDLERLMARRVVGPGMMEDTMEQRPVRPRARALARAAAGLAREPDLARRLLPTLARMRLAERWWARYPDDPRELAPWAARAGRLTGREPWLPGREAG